MEPSASRLTRRIGMTLFLAFLALIGIASVVREPWHTDFLFWFVRWPVWFLLGLLAPFTALRIVFWGRRRRARRSAAINTADATNGRPIQRL